MMNDRPADTLSVTRLTVPLVLILGLLGLLVALPFTNLIDRVERDERVIARLGEEIRAHVPDRDAHGHVETMESLRREIDGLRNQINAAERNCQRETERLERKLEKLET